MGDRDVGWGGVGRRGDEVSSSALMAIAFVAFLVFLVTVIVTGASTPGLVLAVAIAVVVALVLGKLAPRIGRSGPGEPPPPLL